MSSSNYVVLEADTGAAGLAICRSQRVDCVVVELDLSDMSGFKVLLELVPRFQRPDMAVIILSRLNLQTLAELALKNGALAYLVKCRVSGDDLAMTIHRALAAVGPRKEHPSNHSSS